MPFVLERLWRTARGYWAMVVLGPVGFRNGYVNVPEGHPWHGLGYDDIDADVHGGLTFAGEYPDGQLVGGDGVPPGWWIGFDCAHWADSPEPDVWAAAVGSAYVAAGLPGSAQDVWPGHLWTTDEVADQVEFLSAQVYKAALETTEKKS